MENRFNFRCWDIENKHMFYGGYNNWEDTHIKTHDYLGLSLGGDIYRQWEYADSVHTLIDLTEKATDKYILMQSTALKDKNKKEMFESDIASISCTDEKGNIINCFKIISYSVDYGMFFYKNMEDGSYYATLNEISSDRVEIIGNIYENLEIVGKTSSKLFKDKEQQEIDSIGDINYQKDKPMPISY